MTQRRAGSIRSQMIAVTLVAMIPIVVLMVLHVRGTFADARARASHSALESAELVGARVDDYLQVLNTVLIVVERAVSVDPRDAARNDSILRSFKRDLPPYVNNLALWTPSGANIGHSVEGRPVALRRDVADRRYFQDALQTRRRAVGDPIISRSTGDWTVAVAHPILDADRNVVAVLAGSTRLEELSRLITPNGSPDGTLSTIVSRNGLVVARSEGSDRIGQDVRTLASYTAIRTMGQGNLVTTGSDGVRRLSGFVSLTEAPWIAIVGIPEAVAFEGARRVLFTESALATLAVAVSLLLAAILSRRLAHPLVVLANDAQALEHGNRAHRSTVGGSTEVTSLAQAFNRMADAVQLREEALDGARSRYRLLFDRNPGAMWVHDRDTRRILDVNDAALAQYGYPRDVFIGMTVDRLLDSEDPPGADRGAASRGTSHAQLQWHRTSGGKRLAVDVVSDRLSFDGIEAELVLALDVTAREQLQLQLQETNKLESVGRLAGGVAHDFNNLLTVIVGSARFAMDEVGTSSPVTPDLLEIERAAERAAGLTRQLLAFARREIIQPRLLDLNATTREIDRLLRRLLGEHIELTTVLADGLWTVRADPTQIEQVLVNLAINARDAMGTTGHLTIETANVHLDAHYVASHADLTPGDYVMIAVSDTGPGIPPEILAHIFEPFFSTKDREQGTGLGLATCYGIARQNGGGIAVYSETGRGSTFKLYLPRATEAVEAPVADPPAAEGDGIETILVVEDDDAVRHVAVRTLRGRGYTVLEAANGVDALALAREFEGSIALLVTDVVMPRMGGVQLAETLKAQRPSLRVLYCSGYTANAIVHHGELYRGLSFLQKPYVGAGLLQKVREVLDAAE